ncbi:MAG: trypsin-like peptidase domain-containing protein [Bacteroidetes bacterium]|nr:trypsin-like peptidase domain-containing protein [Bacteroidota bacterium]
MNKSKAVILSSFTTLIIAAATFSYIYFNTNKAVPHIEPVLEGQSDFSVIQSRDLFQENQEANDEISNSRHNIITKTVKRISPAIVGINVTEIRQYRNPWSMDPFWRQFFGDQVYNREIQGLGSGTIISKDGYILTNDHVAGNGVKIIITMTDGTQHEAKIIGTDQTSDITLLKIDVDNLPFVELGDSDDIMIGEWVIALGNPFGLFAVNDKPTVTVGVISATGMNLGAKENRYYLSMLQTDAAINSGNSGGALVNSVGQLIGMNTLIYTAQGSSGNVGVGFAIPVNKIKRIINELKRKGKVDRDFWTGLRVQTIDDGIAKYYNLKNTRGVIITNVEAGSPADKAGLETTDVIKKVNDFNVSDYNSMANILQEFMTNDVLNMKIIRNNKELNLKMKLERRND